mmetsp:Transcript_3584/g.11113  ORF Transcript_3584/g.11113 Transcript_3584/m.11113 type:complete len:263 (-) Transcript_3584:520-1308(-)
MDGAAAMPSQPTATQTAATTAAPAPPNRSSSSAAAGVNDTSTTATASSALRTPTASGPSPNFCQTNDAASTRGVSIAVTKSAYARRSDRTVRASDRSDKGAAADASRADSRRRCRRSRRRAPRSHSENAAAASPAAATSQRAANAQARPSSRDARRTTNAAQTRAAAHDVVNSAKSRVRCMCVAAMSVARAVSNPPFATQPVKRRLNSTAEKLSARPQRYKEAAVSTSVATSTGRLPKRSLRSPTYGELTDFENAYAETSIA